MLNCSPRSGRVVVPVIVLLVMAILIVLSVRNWLLQQHAGEELLVLSGTVEARYIRVGSLPGGRLSELHVVEGQLLSAGELIGRTDPLDLPQLLAQAEAGINEAQAGLDLLLQGATQEELDAARYRADAAQSVVNNLELGSRSEDIAAARTPGSIAQAQLTDAIDEVGRLQLLFDQGVVEERRIVAARAQVVQLDEALAISRHRLELLEQGPREEEIDQARQQAAAASSDYKRVQRGARDEEISAAEARLGSVQASRDALQRNLLESTVSSPAAGEVISVPVNPGDLLAPGQTICELLLPESIYIQSFVPENRLSWIKIGGSLEYAIDGLPGWHSATVSFISPVAEFTPRNLQTTEKRVEQVFRVKLAPLEGTQLRPGEICDIRIPAPEAMHAAGG